MTKHLGARSLTLKHILPIIGLVLIIIFGGVIIFRQNILILLPSTSVSSVAAVSFAQKDLLNSSDLAAADDNKNYILDSTTSLPDDHNTAANNINSTAPMQNSTSSIAVIFAGDVRTLVCPNACEDFNRAIFQPLMNANYSVHIFALIKPTVFYGKTSPWAQKNTNCVDLDTPFMNVSKSFLQHSQIEDAIALLSANSRELRVMNKTTAAASWNLTLEQRAKHIGCSGMLEEYGRNNNTTQLIHGGYARFSQWNTVHDGYSMMEKAEIQANERFGYVMRLRPDTRPTMSLILDERDRLPLKLTTAAITHFGDGHSIMPREYSDAYFNVYQTYGNFCNTHLKYNNGQYEWYENPDGYFSKFITDNKGVELATHANFTFWFRRPRTCTELC